MAGLMRADLHIHSALSPCATAEMTPPAVLLTAERLGLDLVGIVDHSTSRNAWAFVEASEAFGVSVLVGIEVESAEGVHILTLFDNTDAVEEMDALIAAHLPPLANRLDIFGQQELVDEWGEVIGEESRLLVAATDLTIEQIAEVTAVRGGLSIPAHVDRPANGLLPTLGFLPESLRVDLLEVSPHLRVAEARVRWPELAKRPLLTSSDAHCLADIGRAVTELPVRRGEELRQWGVAVAAHLRPKNP